MASRPAIVGDIDLALPLIVPGLFHVPEESEPDHRPSPQGRIGIVLVKLGVAVLVERLVESDDPAAERAAAAAHLHRYFAALHRPRAERIVGKGKIG